MATPATLPNDAQALDAFMAARIPAWLRQASIAQLHGLRAEYALHLNLQAQIKQLLGAIIPLDTFARPLLEQMLRAHGLQLDLDQARWREVRLRVTPVLFPVHEVSPPTLQRYNEDSNLLQRALQNFPEQQASTHSHFPGSGIQLGGLPAALAPELFAGSCRALDIGGQYQQHLEHTFNRFTAQTGITPEQLFTRYARSSLRLQALQGRLKAQISEDSWRMLHELSEGRTTLTHGGAGVRVCDLSMLGCALHDCLVFEVLGARLNVTPIGGTVQLLKRVLLYLPGDSQQPLREFASRSDMAEALLRDLRSADIAPGLVKHFTIDQRPVIQQALERLQRQGSIDLDLHSTVLSGDACIELARRRLARIKADAASLAVPTAAVDLAVYRKRISDYKNASLTLLGLFAGLVPGLGELMLGSVLLQTLDEVYEGARDWSHGHREEAIEHLLGVAHNVAVNALLAAGGAAIGRVLPRSAFVDSLQPVLRDDGLMRLWRRDLQPYRALVQPRLAAAAADGLVRQAERHWLQRSGQALALAPAQVGWRLVHNTRPASYAPVLIHNGESAWWLPDEHPLQWHGLATLVRRCSPRSSDLSDAQCDELAAIAGVDEDTLRGLFVQQRPMPARLRDVLEQLHLDRQVSDFLAQLASSPVPTPLDGELCRQAEALLPARAAGSTQVEHLQQGLSVLRSQLFDSILLQRDALDEAVAVPLQRGFPGLPGPYVRELIAHADVGLLDDMQRTQRVPLAVAEQARLQLREARLTRALLGLKLRNGYHPDSARLALGLLRRQAAWPAGLSLELREHSPFGRLIERQLALADTLQTRVLVAREGRFEVYSEDGYALEQEIVEPAGFLQAVTACLSAEQQRALGCAGENGTQRLQQALLTQALAQRERCGPLFGLARVRPLLNRWHALADGRRGYPLSGLGASAQGTLTSMVRSVYPGFDNAQVDRLLGELRAAGEDVYGALLGHQQQLRNLNQALHGWVGGSSPTQLNVRRRFADCLRRCWRRESDRIHGPAGQELGYRLRFRNAPLNDLPVLPGDVSFAHVVDIDLTGTGLTSNADSFLQAFTSVRWLDLARCRLSDVPQAISRMPLLDELYLNGNNIRVSRDGARRLAECLRLQVLNVDNNPLGTRLNLEPLRRLVQVSLRATGLLTLPQGLLGNPRLELADLRGNLINNLPEAFFSAPEAEREAIVLHENPLSAHTLERLAQVQSEELGAPAHVLPEAGLQRWLQVVEEPLRSHHASLWAVFQALPGSADLLRLVADLTNTAEFARVPAELSERAWNMLDAAAENTALREELFDLAAHPTTCVDSVIATFSTLEVRYLLYKALARASSGDAEPVLLQFARQLFRLEQVEQFARDDIALRQATGLEIDEVEVNLGYRVALARTLDLPGQPGHMQFASLANITPAQLQAATRQVQEREASPALAQFVSTRYFWREHLQEVQAARFDALAQRFWERLEALEGQQASLAEGVYLEQMNTLSREREAALDTLAQELTEQVLKAKG